MSFAKPYVQVYALRYLKEATLWKLILHPMHYFIKFDYLQIRSNYGLLLIQILEKKE